MTCPPNSAPFNSGLAPRSMIEKIGTVYGVPQLGHWTWAPDGGNINSGCPPGAGLRPGAAGCPGVVGGGGAGVSAAGASVGGVAGGGVVGASLAGSCRRLEYPLGNSMPLLSGLGSLSLPGNKIPLIISLSFSSSNQSFKRVYSELLSLAPKR